MVENLVDGLGMLFQADSLLYLLLGLLAGFVVGVLPGFQGASGAALMLPFTVPLSLEHALLVLVGIYAGATFSGSVPAILLNVPGTAGAAATAIDGYPMGQKGRAEEAIGIARMSSAIGGTVGLLLIISFIGVLSSLALTFGSREMFAVAIIGLLMIGSLLGYQPLKGILAGLLGVLISMMSASPVTGQPRVTFGFAELYQEVPFIPVLIGLFAFSQMFAMAIERSLITDVSGLKQLEERRRAAAAGGVRGRLAHVLKEALSGVGTTFRYPRTLLRSSVMGTVVGVVPGAGSAVANFLSYGAAKRASRDPESFGKGNPEGVVASEAADNAVTGGTLVPTLTLGVPGSASSAIMLAALVLHGVRPGPQVMETHGAEAYAVLLGLLVASLAILPVGIVLAAPMAQVLRVPPAILVPTICVLSSAGVFAVRRSLFDVGLAILFGVLGLLLRSNGFPLVPVVLGLILGPLAERNFIRALSIGQDSVGYFFDSLAAQILWGALAVLIVSAFIRDRRGRRQAERPPPSDEVVTGS